MARGSWLLCWGMWLLGIPISAGGQDETLDFAADGKGYYSLNEGTFQPLSFDTKK
ncbi:MAG: hypothetical protein FJ095_06880 [Deltaproteobacteria bacterium]|nr:hypothetical protein [Deltaproteobacteria bacterium]